MSVTIEVNNNRINAEKGELLLDVLMRNGIKVPTLCKLEGYSPTGACRMCVVEVEGVEDLVTSCSYVISEPVRIKTHSSRVVKNRKMILELLLANHPDDCLYCIKNGFCELQNLAVELNIRERRISGEKRYSNIDYSSQGIVRDPSKCILCSRCVRVCGEMENVHTLNFANKGDETIVTTTLDRDMNFSNCILCGQCLMVCPSGAIYERTNFNLLQEAINNTDIKVVVQYSPTITVSIVDEINSRSSKDVPGILNAVLRKIGFDKVYLTSFGADIMADMQARELEERIQSGDNLPLISSCCPAWVKYVEQSHPELISNLSSLKSPQQIMGSLIRHYMEKKEGVPADKIFSVAIMPCTAKKYEMQREEMTYKGISDVDLVLTTRELIKLIHLYGINIDSLKPEIADPPFDDSSSAGKLVSSSGGTAEAVARTFYHIKSSDELGNYRLNKLRGLKEKKDYELKVGKEKYNFYAVSGLQKAENLLEDIKNGKKKVDYLEVMACPSGCINGGGQTRLADEKELRARQKMIQLTDETDSFKAAHLNEKWSKILQDLFGRSWKDKISRLFRTTYSKKEVLN